MEGSSRADGSDLERLRIREDERHPRRRRRRWPYVLLGVAAVITVLVIAGRAPQVRVSAAKVGGGGPAETHGTILTANGYIEARHQASVAARTTGRLAAVLVEEGDPVDSAQVVARLLDEDQRAALTQTQANLVLARARLEQADANQLDAQRRAKRRSELLGEEHISEEEGQSAETAAEVAKAERDAAEASVQVARANVDAARLELEKTRVTAPFAGVVLRKDAEVGEIVGPIMTSNTAKAGAVVTIADMKTLEVGIDVNESYIARLAAGTPADIVLDAYPETHFPGEVRAIYPSADRDKATIPVRVRFLAEDPRVRPDLGAKVTFLQRRPPAEIVTVRRVLRVPAAAVRQRDGERFVWRVREGKAEPVTVAPGERFGEELEITSGLSEGDQVVVDGSARLHKGMRVRPVAS